MACRSWRLGSWGSIRARGTDTGTKAAAVMERACVECDVAAGGECGGRAGEAEVAQLLHMARVQPRRGASWGKGRRSRMAI